MIILDTNVVSEASHPSPSEKAADWIHGQNLIELHLCAPVIMEQAYGAHRFFLKYGSRRYLDVLNDLIENRFRGRIVEFDGSAPRLAGEIRAISERNGRRMTVGDAMIAAICLVNGATLATRNTRDFEGIDLKLVNPFEAGL